MWIHENFTNARMKKVLRMTISKHHFVEQRKNKNICVPLNILNDKISKFYLLRIVFSKIFLNF